MAQARCEGCGRVGSAKQIAGHVAECPDYAALYQADPSLPGLDPQVSYAAWRESDKSRPAVREGVASWAAPSLGRLPGDLTDEDLA